jgi:phosphohistidine phosphatase
MRKPSWFYQQSGVIPYRLSGDKIEVLLITSSGRGRWIIPKGVIDPGTTALESACREAYEEAGVDGRPILPSLGNYRYEKWGGTCKVEVFALEISTIFETWPEMGMRRRQWMSTKQAAEAVEEPALKELILGMLER